MTENSQSWGYELHWQSPYDVPLPHQTNPWCQGAVYSAEGSIRATGQDSIPIEVRLGSIRSSIKEEPDPAENLEALAIARLLYAEKHVFDPNVHPLLNLAARKIGITS
ncbi:MAG TPA: hypothetical protein VJ836_02035 [Candidatus Saccharimonadales bacterium]|nr:hypothetical protein [Candidatus Saccharimonadales bacterium]